MKIQLPPWCDDINLEQSFKTDQDAMLFALELVRLTLQHKTGGPFAAVVVDNTSRKIVSFGINLVQTSNCSVLHAEIVAIMLASQQLNTYNLGDTSAVTLYSSAEPCAMCMGAIPWSGISRVVTGATDSDVRAIGFDEGAKPTNWIEEYQQRGISVTTECCRSAAVSQLTEYSNNNGIIYN